MRIDGFTSPILDRGPRTGSAVTPFRDVQREIEQRREPSPRTASATSPQGYDPVATARRVLGSNSASAANDSLPPRIQNPYQQHPLTSHAAQALASYTSTASYGEANAQEVLGLDLYA
jgi:hypothetical protein